MTTITYLAKLRILNDLLVLLTVDGNHLCGESAVWLKLLVERGEATGERLVRVFVAIHDGDCEFKFDCTNYYLEYLDYLIFGHSRPQFHASGVQGFILLEPDFRRNSLAF